jgi:cell wall-associated NlpC family hydrolase
MTPMPGSGRRDRRRLLGLAAGSLAGAWPGWWWASSSPASRWCAWTWPPGLSQTSPGTSQAHQDQRASAVLSAASSPPRAPRPSPATSPQRSTATSPATVAPTGRAVSFALAQRGKPYRWGAEGPDAYDCSGLTWRAWQHAGLGWARMTAAGQWAWLDQHHREIPANQLRAGDLLFYARRPQDPASIHHVAIAIGHGRMVETDAPGIAVRLVPIRWRGLYAAARPVV